MERVLTAFLRLANPPGRSRRVGMGRCLAHFSVAAMPVFAVGGLNIDVARADEAVSAAAGAEYVEVAANSAAATGPKGLEVVLVLDVTGSMYNSFSRGERRIEAMRDAALTLVDALFDDNPEPDLLKVSVVPYNTAVNIGTDMHEFVLDTGLDEFGNPTVPNPFNETTWFGCVQARKNGNDLTDAYNPWATNGTGKWPAYRWPIEPDRRYFGSTGTTRTYRYCETRADHITGDYYRYEDPLTDFEADDADTWLDASIPPNIVNGRRYYDRDTDGPNKGCPGPLLPLTNNRADVWNYLQDVTVVGGNGTITATGMSWGWRVLSPDPPFVQGATYDDDGWEKVIIVLTDGDQIISGQHYYCDNTTYVTNPVADQPPVSMPWQFDPASRNMDGLLLGEGAANRQQREGPDYRWSAYGYAHPSDSAPLGTGYVRTTLENRLGETCDAIKAVEDPIEGGPAIQIFSITFGDSITAGDSISTMMAYCTTDPQNNYFHAPNTMDLEGAVEDILQMLNTPGQPG